jgi:hypothetical protein
MMISLVHHLKSPTKVWQSKDRRPAWLPACLRACMPACQCLFQITAVQANRPQQKKKKIHWREKALANFRKEYKTSGTTAGLDHQLLRTWRTSLHENPTEKKWKINLKTQPRNSNKQPSKEKLPTLLPREKRRGDFFCFLYLPHFGSFQRGFL